MPKKKNAGGKGKTPRVDKAPPTPSSANPQQQNSALPSPERTPTALKPVSLPGSPSTPAIGLPTVSTSLDDELGKTQDAAIAQAELGVTEIQLPTPSEPDVPLPTVVEGDGVPTSQPEPANDTDGHSTEAQQGEGGPAQSDAVPELGQAGPEVSLEATQFASEPEKQAETVIDAGLGDAGDTKAVEDLEKPLPPPEEEFRENGHNTEENSEDLLLQVSEVPVAENQDHAADQAEPGVQQEHGELLGWGDWVEESSSQQLDEALINVDDSASVPVPEAVEDLGAQHDIDSGENPTEVVTLSNTEQEHVEDLIEVVPPSPQPLEPEQVGDSIEQPLEDVAANGLSEDSEISTVEVTGESDPIDPTENHATDSSELHEWDITEAAGDPVEQTPIDGDGIVADPGQIADQDITEDVGDHFEDWPAMDPAVDMNQNPALEASVPDTSDVRLEDAGVHADQAADGQTTEDINPDVSIEKWKVDETTPGETESGFTQELEGGHTLADSDVTAAADVLTEGASRPEETTSMEDLESAEHIPGGWVSDTVEDSNDGLVDTNAPPDSDLSEGLPLDILEETQPSQPEEPAELQASVEPTTLPPLSAQPGDDADKLLPEADPEAGMTPELLEHEAVAETQTALEDLEGAASLQVEGSGMPEESSDSSTALPPNQSTTETEQISPESALGLDVDNPSTTTDPALISDENSVEIAPEANTMTETEDPMETQINESIADPPPEPTLETEPVIPESATALDTHDPSRDNDPVAPLEEQRVEAGNETNEIVETSDPAATNEIGDTDAITETEDRVEMDESREEFPAIQSNSISVEVPTNGSAIMGQESSSPILTAQDVATPEIVAISEMFGTMRAALLAMTNAFDKLTVQTQRMATDSIHIKATEQLEGLKAALGRQIARQKCEVEGLRSTLQVKIKQVAEEKIRARLRDVIKEAVKAQVEEKVRAQMAIQIPDDLRQQVISHQRKIIQVKTDLHNSEARMFNALQTVPGARLRPLLRPLPTPEQSPVVINISRSTSMGSTTLTTPASSFPSGPTPTPIRRTVSNSMRPGGGLETIPPTPSKFFPRDLNALFALSQDEARRLLREYGLKSTAASPAVENNTPMRARGLSIVSEEGTVEEDLEVHARDMNTFMAHIGVPFLMIPPPKEKPGEEAPPLSSRSRRKMLTPLIIK